jgi:hypothetical protein
MLPMSTREEEEKKLPCPKCGTTAPRRLISTFATGASNDAPCLGGSNPPVCGTGGG